MALRRAISGRIVNQTMSFGARSMSTWWSNVGSASKDSNIGLAGASVFSDPNPNKLNVGVGKETEWRTAGNLNMEHPSMGGSMNLTDEKRNAAIQALSGTGVCHHLANFRKSFSPDPQTVVCANEKQASTLKSQLQLVRPMYRNPPVHGAVIGSSLLGESFSLANIRTTHSKAGVTIGNGEFLAKTTLRPLSPHLTVYKPQSSSTTSIFHRIAYIYMATAALFYYLLYLKIGMICFTYEGFYKFFYYMSELFPIINEISVVALAYYLYKGAEHFMKYR